MKRRGPTWALAGLAAAGFVALAGSTALAQEDIYENDYGLSGGIVDNGAGVPFQSGQTLAGPRLNPNGIGQYLVGTFYDVRPYNGDAQIDNIQIINTNTNNSNLPQCTPQDEINGIDGAGCYNPLGGILAKVRFRESKISAEVYDFTIALSCGEVWAGRLDLNASGKPQITSKYPVVDAEPTNVGGDNGFGTVTTSPIFDPASPDYIGNNLTQFYGNGAQPAGISDEDLQRGYIEVIAMERLECEPDSGNLVLTGNVWSRINGQVAAPTNAIGGEVFLVRAASGVSHNYNMVAVSSWVFTGGGSVTPTNIAGAEIPTWRDCVGTSLIGVPYTTTQCIQQSNLALSKSRLIAQYDVDPITGGTTDVVVTMPNKYENCTTNQNTGLVTGKFYPTTPFECNPIGEEAVCTIYDRLENFFEEEEFPISPPPQQGVCRLPREVTVITVSEDGSTTDRGDIGFASGGLPAGESGWLDLDVVRNQGGAIIHSEIYADSVTHDILGVYLQGHHGLPIAGLVMQEFFNGVVGGVYGNTVPPLYEQVILKPGQS